MNLSIAVSCAPGFYTFAPCKWKRKAYYDNLNENWEIGYKFPGQAIFARGPAPWPAWVGGAPCAHDESPARLPVRSYSQIND